MLAWSAELEDRSGAHPAGPSDAERPRGELPWKAARRVPQRKLVPHAQRRKKHPGKLAVRVQLRTAPQLAGLPHAPGVPAESRLCGCGKQRTLPTSAQPRRRRDTLEAKPKPRNSSYEWVRNRGQVKPWQASILQLPSGLVYGFGVTSAQKWTGLHAWLLLLCALNTLCSSFPRVILAGFPTTVAPAGTSRNTDDPIAIITSSPIINNSMIDVCIPT